MRMASITDGTIDFFKGLDAGQVLVMIFCGLCISMAPSLLWFPEYSFPIALSILTFILLMCFYFLARDVAKDG